MAKLYISEYVGLAVVGRFAGASGVGAMAQEPAVVDQTPVAISGTQAQSAAFGSTTKFIRVHTDVICSILIGPTSLNSGAGPEATTSNKRLAANQTEYFGVSAGQLLSVISNT
jgi:hypothetical protein